MSIIKLINDDCRNVLNNLIEENQERNIIIVSDPPFNINYKYNSYKDNLKEDEYMNLIKFVFEGKKSVIVHYPEYLYKIAVEMRNVPTRVVSWVYNSNTARQHRDIAFFNVKPDFNKIRQPYKNLNDKRIIERIKNGKTGAKLYDWWNINQVKNVSKNKTGHPCQMPLEVMKNIVGILPDDALIIDPFMGSGQTGIACKLMNRDFIGIEIDSYYYSIAKEEIEKC